MSYNNVGHLITSTIITLQHFATFHHTSLHLSTLHFLSFTLHYPLIWLNPFTFPIVLFPLTSLNQTQYGYHIPKLISKIMNPFTVLKNLSPFHFTFFSLILSTLHFTSLHFTSLHFAILLLKLFCYFWLRTVNDLEVCTDQLLTYLLIELGGF